MALLEEILQLTGRGRYVFPGRSNAGKPMSEATINQVIKRVGYDGKATGHGFRHTMSTVLHEQGYNTTCIELQLAHVDRNTIRGMYNHAQYMDGQWYADYLDGLRDGGWVKAKRQFGFVSEMGVAGTCYCSYFIVQPHVKRVVQLMRYQQPRI